MKIETLECQGVFHCYVFYIWEIQNFYVMVQVYQSLFKISLILLPLLVFHIDIYVTYYGINWALPTICRDLWMKEEVDIFLVFIVHYFIVNVIALVVSTLLYTSMAPLCF